MTRHEILRGIEAGRISAAEGLRLIRELTAEGAAGLTYFRGGWKTDDGQPASEHEAGDVLVFDEGAQLPRLLASRLREAGGGDRRVIQVRPGQRFAAEREGGYTLRPGSQEDYTRLGQALRDDGVRLGAVLHFWSGRERLAANEAALQEQLALGVSSLFLLCKAVLEHRLAGGALRILYVYGERGGSIQPQHAAISGFARALRREAPQLLCSAVEVDSLSDEALVEAALRELRTRGSPVEVRYTGRERQLRVFEPCSAPQGADATACLREQGVYLITGGLGGLGLLFAEHLARTYRARLVLVGRSTPDAALSARLRGMTEAGAEVLHVQADVSRREDVERVLREARQRFGRLHGVLHAAGVLRDAFLVKKTLEDFSAVLAPKVLGTLWLDELTRQEPLDFFALFSSMAAVLGSVGQCDYAYANRFLDAFAERRGHLASAGERSGRTVSFEWPLWSGGGMSVDERMTAWMKDVLGVELLGTTEGLRAFHEGLVLGEPSVLVLQGRSGSVEKLLAGEALVAPPASAPAAGGTGALGEEERRQVLERAEGLLKELLSRELKLPAARIDPRDSLSRYGIDSLMVMNMSRELESSFGELPKTLFFEVQSLEELAVWLLEHHGETLRTVVGLAPPASRAPQPQPAPAPVEVRAPRSEPVALTRTAPRQEAEVLARAEDIAIVGVAGRYPQAETLEEFWENLRTGRDCVTEIPSDRWDHQRYFDAEKGKLGKSYSKWGGFIQDVDRFDPLFFGISPAEAEVIDPQERLFLETAWQTLEDAGYTRARLKQSRVGVFVGVMYGHYQLFSIGSDGLVYGSSYASIANRVSYFLNLTGPSIAIDTMCSSSLTAIHLACMSIRLGECDMALAGGVNLSVHPYKYQMLSQGRFAASDGRCRSFGEGGDGYVPGEGVGAVLLKPLSHALRDGDLIHAVVKGSSLNHGGRTNGYTVPNPRAQSELIVNALKAAKMDPRRINYIEAHGTGTALGDPIELSGLTRAFKDANRGQPLPARSCAIGSVKSNIGHLESAAGIASVTKVLLQLKHQQLAPSLHSRQLNPNLDFREGPFYVQQELAEWPRPAGDGAAHGLPRQAGISGFGAGGANAHLLLEEHLASTEPVPESPPGPQLIVLSARNVERLRAYAEKWLRFLDGGGRPAKEAESREQLQRRLEGELKALACELLGAPLEALSSEEDLRDQGFEPITLAKLAASISQRYGQELEPSFIFQLPSVALISQHLLERRQGGALPRMEDTLAEAGTPGAVELADLAYTLQVGREAMPERLALVVSSVRELRDKLREFCEGRTDIEKLYHGKAGSELARAELLTGGRAGREFLRLLSDDQELDRLAQLWALGVEVDWEALHRRPEGTGRVPRRISLPTYPFARERYWAREPTLVEARPVSGARPPAAPAPARPAVAGLPLRQQVEQELQRIAANLIKLDPERLDVSANLGDFGFESVAFVELSKQVEARFKLELSPTIFFERGSIRGLVDHLLKEDGEKLRAYLAPPGEASDSARAPPEPAGAREATPRSAVPEPLALPASQQEAPARAALETEPIAVVGMSGRFPNSPDLESFWENLASQVDLISEVPSDRWNWRDFAGKGNGQGGDSTRWGGFVPDVDKFDARFFGISPLEAEMMDPQQRLALETVWSAIEDSGHRPSELSGRRVGLFMGVQFFDYRLMLASQGELNAQMGLGNEHSILVNRISYLLNLRGPSEPCNTACSSSLVAVHRAIRSIRSGESELAIAGGISLMLSPYTTLSGESLGILSPDGRCKTLDAGANGYVRGEGVGALVLKPLGKALEDRDPIYAVIRGTAINHGGKASSLTAPNSEAQAALIVDAWQEADVDPDTISYLELHGTGTRLGDPVEIDGIKSAFKQLSRLRERPLERTQYCGIGSVKTNIGHLEPASGIAGLIKLILGLRHRKLPGLLHMKELNPYVKLAQSPFYVVERTQDWAPLLDEQGQAVPRRAGISSFGFGGVNAHVAVEEPASRPPTPETDSPRLVVLSARTEARLQAAVEGLLAFLEKRMATGQTPSLVDLAYTLQVGREPWGERLAMVVSSVTELRAVLARVRQGTQSGAALHRGKARKAGEDPEAAREAVEPLLQARDLEGLARYWVAGGEVEWEQLYAPLKPYRIPLPSYPFERKRYWGVKAGHSLLGSGAQAPAPAAAPPAGVQEPLSPRPASQEGAASGVEQLIGELRELLAVELKAEPATLEEDTDFSELGVDSILGSVITQRLRQQYSEQIALTAHLEHPSLRQLAVHVAQLLGGAPASAPRGAPKAPTSRAKPASATLPPELLPLNLKGSKQQSFWVHGGPGYAAFYTVLSKRLGPDYPFYAFQARGVDGKTIPHDFDEMVNHYMHCIRLVQPHGPYFLGGYSYGGLVAFEMAQRFHAQGEPMARVVLFDTLPPTDEALSIFSAQYGGDDNFLTIMMANEFANTRQNGTRPITLADLEGVPPRLQVAHVAKLAKQRGKTALSADEIHNYIRGCISLGDYTEQTYNTYRPAPYEGSDVLYFRAEKFLAAGSWLGMESQDIFKDYDYVEAWRQLSRKHLERVDLPGDHFNMLEEPALPISTAAIKAALDGG